MIILSWPPFEDVGIYKALHSQAWSWVEEEFGGHVGAREVGLGVL